MAAYVPDPATRETALQLEEVEALSAAGPKAFKDPRVLEHLLARMEATIRLNRSEFNQLHRQVATIAAERQHQGAPTSLDPMSAARFAPPEEINRLASANLRAKHAQVDAALAEIRDVQRMVTGRVNAIKFAVATLLEEGSLSADSKRQFLDLVRSLPDPTPTPEPVLDLPPPEAVVDEAGDDDLGELFS